MHKLTTTSLKQLTSAITTRTLLNVVPQLQTRLIYDSRQSDDTGFDNTRNNSRSEFGDSFYRKPSYDRSFNNNTDRRPNMTNYNNNGGFSTYSHNSRGTENSYGRGMRDFALEDIDWDKASLQQVKKDFYVEHPNVAAATPESVALFRAEHNLKVTGKDIPNPIMTFEESGLPEPLIQQLKSAGFNKPTNIQSQGWPIALSGRDMIGLAETGSGKTLAFAAPAFVHIKAQAPLRYGDGPIALVLAPTRELAVQIQTECSKFSLSSGIKSMCAYGGSSKIPQMQQLRNGVHMCIATPGRLLDLLSTGAVNLKRVSYLVLDEADRMLDMGFEPQIRQIISQTRPDRQTLMWSATWPREVQSLASEFLTDPISIVVGSHELTVNNRVKQHFDFIENHQKFDQLTETLKLVFNESAEGSAKALIFTNTKRTADEIAHVLQQNGHRASAIHGDKSQSQRDFTLRDFRVGRAKVMVATDVAARGLDVKDITAVINFDFPGTVEDYIHRIGRTARAGTHGKSYTYLSSMDMRNARSIVNILKQANQEIPQPLVDATRPVSNTNRNSSYGGRSRYGSNNRGGYGNDNYNNNRGGYGGGYDTRRGGYDGGRDGFDRRSSSRGSSEYDLEREIRKGMNPQQRGFNFDLESDLKSSW